VEKLRKISPDIAISCDIITGFPAEDEKAFENTVSFIKRIEPMRMHIFTFSPREGTACAGSFACRSAKERYKILKEVSDTFAIKYKNKFIGRVLRMVTEEKKGIYVCGYTENYIRTWLKDDAKIGELVPVRIEKVTKDKVFASTIN
jgi:threonylcarbamoyladenosine tRNA methylthiotransferase MtaB